MGFEGFRKAYGVKKLILRGGGFDNSCLDRDVHIRGKKEKPRRDIYEELSRKWGLPKEAVENIGYVYASPGRGLIKILKSVDPENSEKYAWNALDVDDRGDYIYTEYPRFRIQGKGWQRKSATRRALPDNPWVLDAGDRKKVGQHEFHHWARRRRSTEHVAITGRIPRHQEESRSICGLIGDDPTEKRNVC